MKEEAGVAVMSNTIIHSLRDYIDCKKYVPTEGGMALEETLAYITHYMHNRHTSFGRSYAKGLALYNNLVGRSSDTPLTDDDCHAFMAGVGLKFPHSSQPKFSFIDLFAGIGGFRLAMQEFGGKCVFSSEFNPNAQKTYCFNYGEVPFGDITKESTKSSIPEGYDVLCGGFPCQAFSVAGYRKGFEDTRGTLFFDVADIIKRHKPKVAFLENVRNLEGHDGGRTFEVIQTTLTELGYEVYHKVLDAAEYGNVPQHRERIIIVAFNREKVPHHAEFGFPEPVELTKTIHDCIEPGIKEERYYYRESQQYYRQLKKDMVNPDTVYQWRRVYCRDNKKNLCPTLTANMGAGGHNVPLILTAEGIRKFTPKECLNFMGYPEPYAYPESISESAKYMQAGNSVVVPLMKRVAEQIVRLIC